MKPPISVGDEFPTSCGVNCRVTRYESYRKITIQFMDEFQHEAITQGYNLKSGKVKNPYHRSVFGVGFIGSGDYKVTIDGSLTREYITWRSMLSRCYYSGSAEKNNSYSGCSVSPDWHSLQVFAEWFHAQPFNSLGYDLDKDVVVPGNRIYSAEACAFVPREINSLIVDRRKYRGDLPVGVSRGMRKGTFRAYSSVGGKFIHEGVYSTPEEAEAAYREAKKARVKQVAEAWKDRIDPRVYYALMRWCAPIYS